MTDKQNRVIKFRAWNKEKSEMQFFAGIFNNSRPSTNMSIGPNKRANILNRIGPIEQFTGLQDNNGKEIYEGDIVRALRWDAYADAAQYSNQEVTFNGGRFSGCYSCRDVLEIIGNIHENPKLAAEMP